MTLAAGMSDQAGLIDYSRGDVTVTNRQKFEDVACECSRTVGEEFRRLGPL